MKLLVNNKEVPFENLRFIEDIRYYYSFIMFSSVVFFTGNAIIQDKASKEITILRVDYDSSKFLYTAVHKNTVKIINSVTVTYTGICTASNLLSRNLGFDIDFEFDTVSSFWSLPQLKLSTLISELNKYAKTGNGGGCKFYVNLDGKITFVDLLRSYNQTARNITGSIITDKISVDWMLKVPGLIDIYYYNSKGTFKETLSIKEGFGRGAVNVLDNTGYAVEQMKQQLFNEFYVNYLQSRKITVTNCLVNRLKLGDTFTINNTGKKYILTGYIIGYPSEETQSNYTLTLSSCI